MNDAQDLSAAAAAPSSVWDRLKAAREARGMSMTELASRTRVTQRYLEALEDGRPNDLPSPTYASGFAKAYARAVGLDEVAVGRDVREEIGRLGTPVRQYNIQEIADPARGPSRGLVILTAGLALAVLILGALWLTTGMFRGTEAGPTTAPVAADQPAASAPVPAAPPASGPVVLTATDEVWLRVYDAAGTRLFEGTMKAGDRFQVPAGTTDPMINIGRPDKLAITVGGQPVAPLGDGKRALKDVRISAEALRARAAPDVAPTAAPTSELRADPLVTPNAGSTGRAPAVRASPATASLPPAFRTSGATSASAPTPTATAQPD